LVTQKSLNYSFIPITIYSGSTVTAAYQGYKFKPVIVLPCVPVISSIHFMFHLFF